MVWAPFLVEIFWDEKIGRSNFFHFQGLFTIKKEYIIKTGSHKLGVFLWKNLFISLVLFQTTYG